MASISGWFFSKILQLESGFKHATNGGLIYGAIVLNIQHYNEYISRRSIFNHIYLFHNTAKGMCLVVDVCHYLHNQFVVAIL